MACRLDGAKPLSEPKAEILLIGPLGTNFSEILIEIYIFSSMKIHLKLSSGIWRPFCFGLNVLKKNWTIHWHQLRKEVFNTKGSNWSVTRVTSLQFQLVKWKLVLGGAKTVLSFTYWNPQQKGNLVHQWGAKGTVFSSFSRSFFIKHSKLLN